MARGTLYFVVGPSGVGKDTLIEKACLQRPGLYKMPRTITRDAPNNEHIPITSEEFSEQKRAFGFILTWDAHGLRYGVTRDLEERLSAGQSVILNGSRGIVQDVRAKFEPLRIIHVVARLDVLARRLHERGREDEDEIALRLGGAERASPRGADVITVDNSDSLEDSLAAFLAALD